METYSFVFDGKTYELREDDCIDFINDEQHPVTGIETSKLLQLLKEGGEVDFSVAYFDQPCEECLAGKEEKRKVFTFLDYNFYIFTKKGQYIISSISKEYENTSFNELVKKGQVDDSYIASVIVCFNCGKYTIEIEQCEV